MLRAVLPPESLDDMATTSDGIADKEKSSNPAPLGFGILIRERAEARVTPAAQYGPETEFWIDYKVRESIGFAAPELG
jgi:hypothetical protein